MDQQLMKPGKLKISVSRMQQFFQSAGLLNAWTKGCKKDLLQTKCLDHYCACHSCILFYSTPF